MPALRQGHVLHHGLDMANGPVRREILFCFALQDETKDRDIFDYHTVIMYLHRATAIYKTTEYMK